MAEKEVYRLVADGGFRISIKEALDTSSTRNRNFLVVFYSYDRVSEMLEVPDLWSVVIIGRFNVGFDFFSFAFDHDLKTKTRQLYFLRRYDIGNKVLYAVIDEHRNLTISKSDPSTDYKEIKA